jgi:hypothetical protein
MRHVDEGNKGFRVAEMEIRGEEKTRARKNAIPWWLKRLGLVRAELRGMVFPRTAEEGLRQCAELSALSMELFKAEIGKTLRAGGEEGQERQARRLMNRFSKVEERWRSARRENGVTT